MNTPAFVLGIDAGGTSLRAALVEVGKAASAEPALSRTAPADPDGGPEPLGALVADLLASAGGRAGDVTAVCAGIAKITRGDTKARWNRLLSDLMPQAQVQVVPDYQIAFRGAIAQGTGLAVIAGTGSVAYGESAGQTLRVGGRGWEWGDEGSGAWLTSEMLRRTLRALDGLETASPLTRAVYDLLGTDEPGRLGERARQQIAEQGRGCLVPLLLTRAQSGDAEAQNLYVGAGGWLAALARAGLAGLQVSPDDAPVVATVGGLWQAGELLTVPFTRVLRRWYPHVQVQAPTASPLVGALRLAHRAVD